MKRAVVAAVIAVICWATSAMALDFSADMVSTAQGRSFIGKMYVSGDKSRVEMGGATSITRMDKGITWVVMPGQNMYMEQPIDPKDTTRATDKIPGEIERTIVGSDVIEGRPVNKYRVRFESMGKEEVVLQWVDPQMKIPLKTTSEDGKWSVEYKNLKIEAQPNELFEVPAGYKKFVIPNMKDMISSTGKK